MESQNINKKFIELLEKKVPKKNELINILGDILLLDKRTLYRRLNNEVPFTLPEVYSIANHFHISIDNILNYNNFPVYMKPVIIDNLYKFYSTDILNKPEVDYYNILKKIIQQPYSEQCRVLNMPSIVQFMQHPYLAAMISMYYAFRNGEKVSYEDFRIKDIEKYNENILEILKMVQGCDYTYIILGPSMGQTVIIIIKYLEKLGLIDRAIIEEIKKELYMIVGYDKEITETGKYPLTGKKCDIYISNAPVETNYGYAWSEEYLVSISVMYTLELSISEDVDTFNRMKKWIDSQKRNSILITGTGEHERVNFFRIQEEILDKL